MSQAKSRFVVIRKYCLGIPVAIGTLLLPLISVATADLAPLQPRTEYWGNGGSSHNFDDHAHYRPIPAPVEERSGSIYDRDSPSTDNYRTAPIDPNPTPDYVPYRSGCGSHQHHENSYGTCAD